MTAGSIDPAPVAPRREVTDLVVVLAAVGAWCGARWSGPVPLVVGVSVAGLGWWTRRTVVVVVAVFLLVAALGARAWAGLDPPTSGAFEGQVTLVTDPETSVSGTSALVRTPEGRLILRAHGAPAGTLKRLLAGSRIEARGQITPYDPVRIAARPDRRVVGTLAVASFVGSARSSVPWRLANGVRELLEHGAVSLSGDQRALLAGLVLGDDRAQPPLVVDAFEGAGLTHLLAVSGQNVAFVLAAAAPLLVRLRLWPRCIATASLLVFFALVTRFEPSVLRAVTMALLAVVASTLGRPISGVRVLSGAVIVLLAVDPLLVHSVGFQLSLAATGGILLLAPPIARWLPGPRPLALALAVPLAAQVATGPLIVSIGGSVPLAALFANVAVEPAAGAVMTWGSSAGVLAGVVGGPVAMLVHLPTRLLLWWITAVATWSAAAPLGGLHRTAALVAFVAAGGFAVARRFGRRRLQFVAAMVLVAVLVAAIPLRSPAVGALANAPNGLQAVVGVDGAVVVIIDRPNDSARTLRALRRAGVRSIDLLVITSPSTATWRSVQPVLERFEPPRVVSAAARSGTELPELGARYAVGSLAVEVVAVSPKLRVEVAAARQ